MMIGGDRPSGRRSGPIRESDAVIETGTIARGNRRRDKAQHIIDADRQDMLALCHQLEELADDLPDSLHPGQARRLGMTLGGALERHVTLYETLVFDALVDRDDIPTAAAIEQAKREHREMLGLAIELGESLIGIAETKASGGSERLGLLLRNMFEGLARHLCWEQITILEAFTRFVPSHEREQRALALTEIGRVVPFPGPGLRRP